MIWGGVLDTKNADHTHPEGLLVMLWTADPPTH
jgi:hypothetical protein